MAQTMPDASFGPVLLSPPSLSHTSQITTYICKLVSKKYGENI